MMRLVGSAIADYSISSSSVTAIGFATWGNIAKRDELDAQQYIRNASCNDDDEYVAESIDRTYTGSAAVDNSRGSAALESNHSHFVLVDSGEEGGRAWGGEIALRAATES